ncbi:hypothetical protein NXC14_PA00066 (plasmid) [Rhizobium sp. NXC14]|uniref:hypothetical protein n=1 Tax=Rhizobium sp. NXC14 TaxID=1981173 RepID=UPI000A2060E6|nr:hypothetical protein [Rhizobium sp. NXC14]ARO32362.1 hypothetical protein NXC14_PA00066 [Rhizobium sp. NXC14]
MHQPVTELQIDVGLSITVTDAGDWIVKADGRDFQLKEISDFYRAWLLLERPFPDVKAAFDQIASNAKKTIPFPFAKLIASALKAKSGEWTDRAMLWVSFLTEAEKASLKDLFIEARDSKWASQKSRQLARQHLTRIERSR